MKKENGKRNESLELLIIVSAFAFAVTLILSFMNVLFISACMLMLAFLLFSIYFFMNDSSKKIKYILYILGILLIVGALVYMFVVIY
jgi:hypothetical protein